MPPRPPLDCPLRILLSNNHLEVRAGSELVTLEIAEELSRRGHTVGIFTHQRGGLAEEFEDATGISVLTPRERSQVADWQPDILHIHHWPTLAYLRAAGLTAPAVIGFLGVLPDLENPPPPDHATVIPWWSVSEEVRDNVTRDPRWAARPHTLIRNWFDDDVARPSVGADPVLRSMLVVSNHFPPEAMDLLAEAGRRRGISLEKVGLPDNPRPISAELLAAHDAVVSLGRTAITAMAHGRPVLVLDHNGADGWVTAASIDRIAASNFSGRALGLAVTEARVEAWLDDPPTRSDLEAVQGWTWQHCRLSTAVDRLESLYAQALAADQEAGAHPWQRIVGGYIQHAANLEEIREDLTVAVESLRTQNAALTERLDALQGALAQSERSSSEQAALIADLLGSASWRATVPLRAAVAAARRARTSLSEVGVRRSSGAVPTGGDHRGYESPHLAVHAAAAYVEFREREKALPRFRAAASTRRPTVRTSTAIPTMAWIGELDQAGWSFTLGASVESFESGFFEGVWAGAFSAGPPVGSEFVFGSGATWQKGGPLFTPPRHPKDSLYVLGDAATGRSWVSNSLAFVLEAGSVDQRSAFFLRVAERLQDYAVEDQLRGVDRTQPIVAHVEGLTLSRVVYHDFEVGSAGTLRRHWLRPRRHFADYDQYRDLLLRTLGALIDNGTDTRRQRPLRPLTAVSAGYDSTAVTALVRRLGVTEAVTLDVVVYGRSDSGRAIAQALGMTVTEHPHVMSADIADLNMEALPADWGDAAWEFLATAGRGDDINHLGFHDALTGSIFFSGTYGDAVWAREPAPPSGLSCGPWGTSLSEYRLRTGFAWVPVPIIGARFAPDLARVSTSEEMQPYTLGTDYDRPVPRRIAEEAGVPRHLFGVAKTATAPYVTTHSDHLPRALSEIRPRYRDWRH